jgi:hypothetical protein
MTYLRGKPTQSWHLFRTWSRVPGLAITVCGRRLRDPEERDDLPAQRTCEACYRVKAAAEVADG